MVKTRSAETLALDKNQQKKVTKQTKKIKKGIEDGSIQVNNTHKESKLKAEQKRGLIYIGHIPHGFYEDEMRDYFKQFGKVTNVKVCRSRTSGNSKGFGYVEFAHPEVAKIAADTMNNYVMFKKRIVTEFVPYEKRPKGLFYGKSSTAQHTSVKSRSGKQKFSRNKMLDATIVTKKRKNTLKKLNSKLKKLQDLGIQCNIQPVGLDEEALKQLKMEQQININPIDVVHDSDSDDVEFKKPSTKLINSKNVLSSHSKESSDKSLTTIRSKRTFLTKSLDSVKTLLSSNTLENSHNAETQTVLSGVPKTEKRDGKKKKLKGIVKAKMERKPVVLNREAVKKIARELIRRRGSPRINVSTHPKKMVKQK